MPIGIFDSGLGGLTVAAEVRKLFAEGRHYIFRRHRPCSLRQPRADVIRRYAGEDADFLLSKGVAYHRRLRNGKLGGARHRRQAARSLCGSGGAGLDFGRPRHEKPPHRRCRTAATVSSGSFVKAIGRINPNISVFTKACPFLSTLWRKAIFRREIPFPLVTERYLEPLKAAEIDTLILGCTHFPMLSEVISDYMGEGVTPL